MPVVDGIESKNNAIISLNKMIIVGLGRKQYKMTDHLGNATMISKIFSSLMHSYFR